jgi:hypothetical protein
MICLKERELHRALSNREIERSDHGRHLVAIMIIVMVVALWLWKDLVLAISGSVVSTWQWKFEATFVLPLPL